MPSLLAARQVLDIGSYLGVAFESPDGLPVEVCARSRPAPTRTPPQIGSCCKASRVCYPVSLRASSAGQARAAHRTASRTLGLAARASRPPWPNKDNHCPETCAAGRTRAFARLARERHATFARCLPISERPRTGSIALLIGGGRLEGQSDRRRWSSLMAGVRWPAGCVGVRRPLRDGGPPRRGGGPARPGPGRRGRVRGWLDCGRRRPLRTQLRCLAPWRVRAVLGREPPSATST